MFFATIRSTRSFVIDLDIINCSPAVAAGSGRFNPPSLVGNANNCLSVSLGASLPVSFGIRRHLMVCSRGFKSMICLDLF